MKKFIGFLLSFGLLIAGAANATNIYSNTSNGSSMGCMGGSSCTSSWGELLTLPTTQALQSFSFYLASGGTAGNIDLEIGAWDSSTGKITGPEVYASSSPQYWGGGASQLTFNNINTLLQGGTQYVVFMTVATPGATSTSFIPGAATNVHAYEGTAVSFSQSMAWAIDTTGVDPIAASSPWSTPASLGMSANTSLEFSATTTATTLSSPSASAVTGPRIALLMLGAILGLMLLTITRNRAVEAYC